MWFEIKKKSSPKETQENLLSVLLFAHDASMSTRIFRENWLSKQFLYLKKVMFLLVFGCRVGVHLDRHQHGVSIQISINLGKKIYPHIVLKKKIAVT